jgi:nicotinamide-nucleotide amidase
MNDLLKSLVMQIFEHCQKHNLKIRTVESCSGGGLASLLTTIPGSSQYFDSGIVVYSNEAKQKLVAVPKSVLEKYGAVSFEAATIMAENSVSEAGFISIVTTGILGPAGGTNEKPVGLVYIANNICNKHILAKKYIFSGSRDEIKEHVLKESLKFTINNLMSNLKNDNK